MFAVIIAVLAVAALLKLVSWWGYKPTLYDSFDAALKKRAPKIKYPKYANLPKNCLVTGGSGFLGRHLVEALLEQGCSVTVFDLRKGFSDDRVKFIEGNLVKKDDLLAACKGMDVVFHVASPAHHASDDILVKVNVDGTKNVVDCCLEAKVPRLVFTSSASVVYGGADQVNVDESTPYPSSWRDTYSRTKAEAEKIVLKAATESGGRLSVVSVRPHGLYGPRDPMLLPTLTQTAKAGKLKFAIGTGETIVDFTYIGNVVHSHLLAAENCTSKSKANGKAYFITNDEPVSFWGFMFSLLHGLGYTVPNKRIPYFVMLYLAYFVELLVALLRPIKAIHVTFSSSRMQLCGTHHYYSCNAAKSDLGYKPVWTVAEGLYLTLRSFRSLRNPKIADSAFEDDLEEYTVAEVAKHNREDDAWLIIEDRVYNITDYVELHPGGDKILRNAGGDATEGFFGPQHPTHVFETVKKFQIGTLVKE